MKNFILAVLLLGAVASAQAAPDRSRDKVFAVPSGAGEGGSDTNAKWSMPSIARADFTTTAQNPADGRILIHGACVTSTSTAGGYLGIYDSDAISGLTLGSGIGRFLAAIQAKIIQSNGSDTKKSSCEFFERPLPATSGLVFLTSEANIRATVIYDKIAD